MISITKIDENLNICRHVFNSEMLDLFDKKIKNNYCNKRDYLSIFSAFSNYKRYCDY